MSDNRKFSVKLNNADGTFSIYHNTSVGKFPIYTSSKTASTFTPPLTLSLKYNGELILRDSNILQLWKNQDNSGTSETTLHLNDNGNLEIYNLNGQLVWQSQSLNLLYKFFNIFSNFNHYYLKLYVMDHLNW